MGNPVEPMLPGNPDIEKSLLGCLLIDPEMFPPVSEILCANDFYRDAHRQVFEVMQYLVDRQERVDVVSISEELTRRHIELERGYDNIFYLQDTCMRVPTSGSAETYARIIEDAAVRRRLIHAAGMIAASAHNDTAEEALENAEECVFSIGQRRNKSSFSKISEVMSKCMERLDRVSQTRAHIIGIPSGFFDLDRLTRGFRKGALYILAARPAMGKTSMMLNMMSHAAKQGYKVAAFSLEMTEEELGYRLISSESGIDSTKLQTGWVEDEDWERVERVMSEISERDLFIDDTGGISIAQLRNKARQIKAKQGLDIIFVDYLQLLTAKKDGKTLENRVQEISEISKGLKNLAKELDIPILSLAQLSRAVELRQNKIPQLSDLRESGSIEADADAVMFIYRDDVYNPNSERKGIADIIVAKHRNGPVGEISLFFKPELTRFANLEIITPEVS